MFQPQHIEPSDEPLACHTHCHPVASAGPLHAPGQDRCSTRPLPEYRGLPPTLLACGAENALQQSASPTAVQPRTWGRLANPNILSPAPKTRSNDDDCGAIAQSHWL
ncbi:hypothetical protein CSOJ01_12521 [Colletotrichum sojae]|uniref:Uncharacterized protein n=1 Tax=Colletotrichum sojae TaxID=2175907 RepID=A0A8H6IUM2_9PEZI|nr:hypothetical protein CSOJ01_12521 [Colletotrichum sojae]